MHNPTLRLTFLLTAFIVLHLCLFCASGTAQESKDKPRYDTNAVGDGSPYTDELKRTYTSREVTKKAVVYHKPEPNFTVEARKNDLEGTVRLRLVLGSDGKVSQLTVVKGLPDGLTEEAIKAARAIRFTPAQKDGRNVSQWVVIEYNFNIYYDEDDREITRKAVILEKPTPGYTDEARSKGTQGKVVLSVILTRDGKVGGVEVVKGLPDGLTQKAIEAARAIRFQPAEASGRPVSVLRNVEYIFTLY
jgi:TonB family protein